VAELEANVALWAAIKAAGSAVAEAENSAPNAADGNVGKASLL
jgi:hypothetical protein